MDLKIIDDFLPEDEFEKIETNLMSHVFPWYYVKKITDEDHKLSSPGYQYQFCHVLFAEHQIMSNFFQFMLPVLEKLKAKSLFRIKANCIPKSPSVVKHGYHIDTKNCRTAILFINTNDGATEFKSGKTVYSKRNRLIEFDSNMYHRGTTCTDAHIRVNININYFKFDEGETF